MRKESWLVLGTTMGMALGVAFRDIGTWLSIGFALGIALSGRSCRSRRQKEVA